MVWVLGVASSAPFAMVPRGEEEYVLSEMAEKGELYMRVRPRSRFVESARLEGVFLICKTRRPRLPFAEDACGRKAPAFVQFRAKHLRILAAAILSISAVFSFALFPSDCVSGCGIKDQLISCVNSYIVD